MIKKIFAMSDRYFSVLVLKIMMVGFSVALITTLILRQWENSITVGIFMTIISLVLIFRRRDANNR